MALLWKECRYGHAMGWLSVEMAPWNWFAPTLDTLIVYQGCLVSHSSGIWDISRMAPWLQQVWPVAPVDSLCQVKALRGPMGSQLCWGLHLPCAGLQCPISFWAEKWPAYASLTMKMNGYEWYVLWFMRSDPQEVLISDEGIVDIDGASCSQTPCLKREMEH